MLCVAAGYGSDSSEDVCSSSSEDGDGVEVGKERSENCESGDGNKQSHSPESRQEDGERERESETVDVRAQFSEDSSELKRPMEGGRERGKERRPFLERLKLVRKSSSPDRGEGDGGGIMMTVRKGLQSLNGERLAVVGRGEGGDSCESGEFGEGGVAGEMGEEGGGTEEGGKDGGEDRQEEEEAENNNYSFTLALVSRRSRHRAGRSLHTALVDEQYSSNVCLIARDKVQEERGRYTGKCGQLC